jgi:hypothetical protein
LCPVTLSPGNASHPSSSSTGAVSVAAASDCAWYVFNTNSWILITSATNGTGNGTVSYVLATNPTTSARSGNIQIADQIFPITQLAGATNPPPNCTIAISPTNRIHGYANASNLVFVTTQNGCAWNVVNTNPWVSIHSSLNNVGSGTVNYSLALNANADARSGNVIIGGQLFRLTQQGAGTNAPRLQIMARTGTNAMLSVQGEAGKMYIVEGSEDLIHWTPISTNSAPSTVTDATVGNAPRRFYRTVESP